MTGEREGNAASLTAQRNAINVKNVVASDSFGNIADGNIGDFLQQMPGITAVYVGADVRSVQIRGIDGALKEVPGAVFQSVTLSITPLPPDTPPSSRPRAPSSRSCWPPRAPPFAPVPT